MKRYIIYLDHFNDESSIIFQCDKLEVALRFIADNIEGVEYPDDEDNAKNMYCYRLYDSKKVEDDGNGNMIPAEIFCTDYFYM